MTEQVQTIKLELPLLAVNYIMSLLIKQPFEQVELLVQDIRNQATGQLQPPEPQPPEPQA
jgi:hypothetical protein